MKQSPLPSGERGLGTLAQTAAALNNPPQAKSIADEITIPELRAFYLLAAYETFHPLHPATRDWPLFRHFKPAAIRIGA